MMMVGGWVGWKGGGGGREGEEEGEEGIVILEREIMKDQHGGIVDVDVRVGGG